VVRIREYPRQLVKAKFHYASWFEAGSKLMRSRFEAGSKLVGDQLRTKDRNGIWLRTCLRPASNQLRTS